MEVAEAEEADGARYVGCSVRRRAAPDGFDPADPGMIHCPMTFCQTPVPKPTNVEAGSGWERLRECPECEYSFCAYCKRTWYDDCHFYLLEIDLNHILLGMVRSAIALSA